MVSSDDEPCLRLFAGLSLSEEAREFVIGVIAGLRYVLDGVRWVPPENLHVTMKFLASCDPRLVPALLGEMEDAASHLPIRLRLGGVGGYPSVRSAKVIWVGAEDLEGRARKAFDVIESGTERLGFAREKRLYSPHVTVGRARAKPLRVSRDICEGFESTVLLEAEEIVLFRSELKRSGAEYSIVGRAGRSGLR